MVVQCNTIIYWLMAYWWLNRMLTPGHHSQFGIFRYCVVSYTITALAFRRTWFYRNDDGYITQYCWKVFVSLFSFKFRDHLLEISLSTHPWSGSTMALLSIAVSQCYIMWLPRLVPANDRLPDVMRNEWLGNLDAGYQPFLSWILKACVYVYTQ